MNLLARKTFFILGALSLVLGAVLSNNIVNAQVDNPQSDGIGLQGRISSPPPKAAPTISTPTNGTSTSQIPMTVRGICTDGYLVKIFKNNVFSGSDYCQNGSFSIIIDFFAGRNELVARHYDDFDQAGPDSNLVVVNYSNANDVAGAFERVTMTSVYAKRGADPGKTIIWPISISGGIGPYAISVDWGDGSLADVYVVDTPGEFKIQHAYDSAGVYRVIVKATDKNGLVGFLQITAIANGEINDAAVAGAIETEVKAGKTRILWEPIVLTMPFIIATFYLGRKYAVTRIKHRISHGEDPFS